MRFSDALPSNSALLKAQDLGGKEVRVIIESVEYGVQLGEDKKPVLHFRGKEKGLALNKTNGITITDVYGEEMDDWIGLPIILYTARVLYDGKMVPAIRVRIPDDARKAAQGRMAEPPPADEPPDYTDDDIPF